MTVQIKEITIYTTEGKEVYTALFINDEKVSCKKDYSASYYELTSAEKEICKSFSYDFETKEETKLYKELSGTKAEIIEKIQNIGYSERIENDFCICVENAEEEVPEEKKVEEKKYSGYGYHGGGRKATGVKRASICISGQPEQINKLKELAQKENKTVSSFIFSKVGATMEKKSITVTIFNNGEKNIFGWSDDHTLVNRVIEEVNKIRDERISCLITYQYMKLNSDGNYIGNGNVWNVLSACCNDRSNWVSRAVILEELKKVMA